MTHLRLTIPWVARDAPWLVGEQRLAVRRWFDDGKERPTCRRVLEHVRLIEEVDPSYPIILGADGRVMDGMHRVAKALLAGNATIEAVQFETDPEPDYLGRAPDDLPY